MKVITNGLLHAIPLNSTVAGKRFKLKFEGVPELLISEMILPALEKLGQVRRVSTEEDLAHNKPEARQRRAQAIGDFGKVSTFQEKPVEMRGDGGSDIKRTKLADNCANVVERSQRCAASGMRQMKEDSGDTVE